MSILAILMSEKNDSLECPFELSLLLFCIWWHIDFHFFLPQSSLGNFCFFLGNRAEIYSPRTAFEGKESCALETHTLNLVRQWRWIGWFPNRGRHVFESVIAITDFGVHIEWVNPPSSVPWALSTLHCLLQLFFLCNRFPPFFLISKITPFLCQELSTRWWGTCCLSIYIMVGQFIYSSPSNFTPAKRGYGVSSGLSILNIEKVFGELLGSSESHWLLPVSSRDGRY